MPEKARNTERANPLASAGLQPKATAQVEQKEGESGRMAELSGTSVVDRQPEPQGIPVQRRKSEEEQATEKVTAYFTPPQYDKIEELRRLYRKRVGKRISVNALLRQLVERATVEDIFPY
jgi:hypothetical protein